jgi:DNA-3-methyladenine glycosylase
VPHGRRTALPDNEAGLTTLPREFLDRPSPEVAPGLLGCVLEHETGDGLVAVMLTEVEAYAGETDPASHAYRGKTRRNAVMFGPPGYAYVYFTYGMHFCVNVVCGPGDTPSALLLRAGRVIAGEELAASRRHGGRARDLARGPARLCQALAIDRAQNGADLCDPRSPLRLRSADSELAGSDGQPLGAIRVGPRVGIREAADIPWRFWLADDPSVSVYRPAKPRETTRAEIIRMSRLQTICNVGKTLDLTSLARTRKVLLAPRGTERRKAGRDPGSHQGNLLPEALRVCSTSRADGGLFVVAGGSQRRQRFGKLPETELTRRNLSRKV